MGTYDVTREGSRTVIRKRHPILRRIGSGLLVYVALVYLIGTTVLHPWAVVLAAAFIAAVIGAGRMRHGA